MADAIVRTASVELRTCKLTKSLLKQFPVCNSWDDLRKVLSDNVRSPYEDQRLKLLDAKPGKDVTDDERQEVRELSAKKGFSAFLDEYTLGWIHGSVFGDEFDKYLVVNVEPGQYVLYKNPHSQTISKFKQVFVV